MTKPLLTFTSAKVAKVLISQPDAEHWGVKIYQDAGVAAGTVYPMLEHWKSRGWITDRPESSREAAKRGSKGPPRRYWRLTSKGLTELTDYVHRWDAQERSSRVAR